MTKWMTTYGPLAARVFLAPVFLINGLHKVFDFSGTEAYMAAAGIPQARAVLVLTILIEVLGGAALLLGYLTRVAAVALAAFLVPVTLLLHAFWPLGGAEQQQQLLHFLKNVAILGGLLAVSAHGAGELGFDARYSHERALARRLAGLWQRIAHGRREPAGHHA